MSRTAKPGPQDLEALDPDNSFRYRLEADRAAIAQLGVSGDLEQLRRIVHALAGAAGTFGYAALGEIAIELDDRLAEVGPVTAVDVARLLAALEQALEKPVRSA